MKKGEKKHPGELSEALKCLNKGVTMTVLELCNKVNGKGVSSEVDSLRRSLNIAAKDGLCIVDKSSLRLKYSCTTENLLAESNASRVKIGFYDVLKSI